MGDFRQKDPLAEFVRKNDWNYISPAISAGDISHPDKGTSQGGDF